MKKILILTLLAVLASSCSVLQPVPDPASGLDTQATIDAIVRTSAAQTLAAQPSPTTVPTETATPVLASSPTTEVSTDGPSSTPLPNLTTTPATATSGPGRSNLNIGSFNLRKPHVDSHPGNPQVGNPASGGTLCEDYAPEQIQDAGVHFAPKPPSGQAGRHTGIPGRETGERQCTARILSVCGLGWRQEDRGRIHTSQ
jgi:hypothetical protein